MFSLYKIINYLKVTNNIKEILKVFFFDFLTLFEIDFSTISEFTLINI